jgi:hypothetical protein
MPTAGMTCSGGWHSDQAKVTFVAAAGLGGGAGEQWWGEAGGQWWRGADGWKGGERKIPSSIPSWNM